MFTSKFYIRKNNKHLKFMLDNIGYEEGVSMSEAGIRPTIIVVHHGVYDLMDHWIVDERGFKEPHVECYNDESFYAIAAIRDDTDVMQLFTNGDKWICSADKVFRKEGYHKAIPEEIIKYYSKDERKRKFSLRSRV